MAERRDRGGAFRRTLHPLILSSAALLSLSLLANPVSAGVVGVPTGEFLRKEVSPAFQERVVESACTGGWDNSSLPPTCLGWTNTTRAGRSLELVDSSAQIVAVEKPSPYAPATRVTVRVILRPNALTALAAAQSPSQDKSADFNSQYLYSGRDVNATEMAALRSEASDLPVAALKGRLLASSPARLDLLNSSAATADYTLELEGAGSRRSSAALKVGSRSTYWTVDSQGDFTDGTVLDNVAVTSQGTVVLGTNNTSALWHMDNSGTDDSGNINTLSLSGTTTYRDENYTFGGYSLRSADGIWNYAYAASSSSWPEGSAMTVEAWVRANATICGSKTYCGIVNRYTSGTADWYLRFRDTGVIEFAVNNGTSSITASGGSLSANTWTHVAGVYNGSKVSLIKVRGV